MASSIVQSCCISQNEASSGLGLLTALGQQVCLGRTLDGSASRVAQHHYHPELRRKQLERRLIKYPPTPAYSQSLGGEAPGTPQGEAVGQA